MKVKLQSGSLFPALTGPFAQSGKPGTKKYYLAALLVCICLNGWAQSAPGVIFRDDFNRTTFGPGWLVGYQWSLTNNKAFNLTDGPGATLLTTQSFPDSSFIIESSASGFTSGYHRSMFIVFGQTGNSPDYGYVLSYSPYEGGQFVLGRAEGNVYYPTVLDETVLYPRLIADQYYSFKVARYKSGLIQVFLNKGQGYGSVPVLEAIDKKYPVLGRFGWQVNNETAGEPFYVDFIEASRPTIEKPAVPEKPVQDSLIANVIVANGKQYPVAKLAVGATHYTDRNYTITALPSYLQGASFIKTANNDKTVNNSDFLQILIRKSVIAYVGYDPRAITLPAWLTGWTKTGDRIGTTDPGSSYLDVYSKVLSGYDIYPNYFHLGSNLAAPAQGSNMNYLFALIPYPSSTVYEAESAKLSGVVVATNQPGYSGAGFADFINPSGDYVEWNVNVAASGSYSLVFKFTNGSAADRPLAVSVNGISRGTATFGPTGNWQSWSYYAWSPSILLKSGVNTIRITATGSSGPNIDNLAVVPSGTPPASSAARRASPETQPAYSAGLYSTPNPFSHRTLIRYVLREKMPVRLAVYDLRGRQVAVLVDGLQEAGPQEAAFEAGQLPPGIYLYKLEAGHTTQTRRVVLTR